MSERIEVEFSISEARDVLEQAIAEDIRAGRLLEVSVLARRWKVHPNTVRYHIRTGELKASRIGRSYRITEAAALSFLLRTTQLAQLST